MKHIENHVTEKTRPFCLYPKTTHSNITSETNDAAIFLRVRMMHADKN